VTLFRRVADRARLPAGEGSEQRYRLVARFSAAEAVLLRELVSQIAELLGGPGGPRGPVEARDPAEAAGVSETAKQGEPPVWGEPGDRGLGGDLADALGLTEDAGLPDDPALARLLPDAYVDDPDASSEFRRYTEKDLRAGKVAAAKTVLDTLPEDGGRISLSQSEAQVWLRALNDIRLALGVRLGITEDMYEEMGRIKRDDPRYSVLAVYDWLSGTQESLVHALW
jgi:hypothetical protein